MPMAMPMPMPWLCLWLWAWPMPMAMPAMAMHGHGYGYVHYDGLRGSPVKFSNMHNMAWRMPHKFPTSETTSTEVISNFYFFSRDSIDRILFKTHRFLIFSDSSPFYQPRKRTFAFALVVRCSFTRYCVKNLVQERTTSFVRKSS